MATLEKLYELITNGEHTLKLSDGERPYLIAVSKKDGTEVSFQYVGNSFNFVLAHSLAYKSANTFSLTPVAPEDVALVGVTSSGNKSKVSTFNNAAHRILKGIRCALQKNKAKLEPDSPMYCGLLRNSDADYDDFVHIEMPYFGDSFTNFEKPYLTDEEGAVLFVPKAVVPAFRRGTLVCANVRLEFQRFDGNKLSARFVTNGARIVKKTTIENAVKLDVIDFDDE